MKNWAVCLLQVGNMGGGTVFFTALNATQLGASIVGALDELGCEKDSVAAYRVSCAALEKERDSLKSTVDKMDGTCRKMLEDREAYRRERDSMRRALDHSNGVLENLEAERDSIKEDWKALAAERDSLKHRLEVLNDPLVELAVRFVNQCKAAVGRADAFANEKEAKLKGGGIA